MGTELGSATALTWGDYKLLLVDGRLMVLLASGDRYELHLEEFMNFNWNANAYGEYAKSLNILYYKLKGKSLRGAIPYLAGFLSGCPLDYLKDIKFATAKNGELKPFFSEWS